MSPGRIQRQRVTGWRIPEGAVYVGRPTQWGNPFIMYGLVRYGPRHLARFGRAWDYEGRITVAGTRHDLYLSDSDVVETYVREATPAELVEMYRLTLTEPTAGMCRAYPSHRGQLLSVTPADIRRDLAGKDLVCWCPLDQPCHADVLLEMANVSVESHSEAGAVTR
jgi:hypothetical protein